MNIKDWNDRQLKARGINATSIATKAVRTVGDAKVATLYDGTKVYRSDGLYVEGYGLVKTAKTELHFVYETPAHMKGWGLYCTCGSIAGVVGYGAYSKLASPTSTGYIIACIRHLSTKNNVGVGEHADGSHE